MSIDSNPNMKEWLREYAAGAGWELYRVAMSPFFEGTSFSRSHARLLRFCHVGRYLWFNFVVLFVRVTFVAVLQTSSLVKSASSFLLLT
jgi:hypothetical protein